MPMDIPLAARLRDALREVVLLMRRQYLTRVWKMDIGEGTAISGSAKLDKTNPRGVHIGRYSVITFAAAIVTHDYVNSRDRDARIRDNCFIGPHSIVLPVHTIRDGCIVL